MRMSRTSIDFKFLAHLATHLGLRQHAPNRRFQYSLRMALKLFFGADFFESARIARVMVIDFLLPFIAGEDDLLGIDDDDVIADIEVRSIRRFVFAHQNARGFCSKAAYGFAVGVDDKPLAALLKVLAARYISLHDTNLPKSRKENEREEYENGDFIVKGSATHLRNGDYLKAKKLKEVSGALGYNYIVSQSARDFREVF